MKCFGAWYFILFFIANDKIDISASCMKYTECLQAIAAETQKFPCPWLWTSLTCWERYQSLRRTYQHIREFFSYQNNHSKVSKWLHIVNHNWSPRTFFKFSVVYSERQLSILKSSFRWSYLPTPPLGQDMTQGQFFKRSLTGLNSKFSFS